MLEDVYFGDVFLCGGQSNMQYKVSQTDVKEYEESIAINYPNIRFVMVATNNSVDPFYNASIESKPGHQWLIPNNVTIQQFSAICWINGRLISEYLLNTTNTKRYIGLIESAVGGTTVHFWV